MKKDAIDIIFVCMMVAIAVAVIMYMIVSDRSMESVESRIKQLPEIHKKIIDLNQKLKEANENFKKQLDYMRRRLDEADKRLGNV